MKQIVRFLALLMLMAPAVTASDQLDALGYTEGRWSVAASYYADGKWGAPLAPQRATADTILGGAFIRLNAPIAFPGATFQFEMTLSYDRFNGAYRFAFLDDLNGYLDVYTGQMADGVLTVTNASTGTAFPDGQGGKVIGKLEMRQTDTGFQILSYIGSSADGPFRPYMTLNFTPAE